jgi:Four helix bundle sensory module for signal transduction
MVVLGVASLNNAREQSGAMYANAVAPLESKIKTNATLANEKLAAVAKTIETEEGRRIVAQLQDRLAAYRDGREQVLERLVGRFTLA